MEPLHVGPAALKALAHPLRVRLVAELGARGAATASQLADALEESSGATSYHLRQLERHGFVEEDPERGTARERVWIPARGGYAVDVLDLAEDPDNAPAVDAVLHARLQQDAQRTLAVMQQARTWPREWRDATWRRDTHVVLDAVSAAKLHEELDAVIDRYRDAEPAAGARRVAVGYSVLPTEHEEPA